MRRSAVASVLFTFVTALVAEAQPARTYRIAYVSVSPRAAEMTHTPLQTLRDALRDLGYVEGGNLIFDVRYADGDFQRVPALVDELIALRPDVLLGFEQIAQVMRAKTTTTPIVLTGALDPVRAGLAQSLRRPGLNVTGSTQLNDELPAKHIEIMRQIHPRLARIGQLVDTTASGCQLVEAQARHAAQIVGAALISYHVASRADVQAAFRHMQTQRPDMLLPCPSAVLASVRPLLFEHALRLRIPLTSFVVANVPLGVLFAYAARVDDGYRRAATYVDKILKGANPGDLPIEQPTRFELVINLQTARAIGLTIPSSVLARADEVIQ